MVGQFWLETDEGVVSNEQPLALLEVESARAVRESGGIFDGHAAVIHQKSYQRHELDGVNSVVASALPEDRIEKSFNLPRVQAIPSQRIVAALEDSISSNVQVERQNVMQPEALEEMVPTASEDDNPYTADLADQYLVSASAVTKTPSPTSTTSAVPASSGPVELTCPTACLMSGEELCTMAKAACSVPSILTVPSAYLGCLSGESATSFF